MTKKTDKTNTLKEPWLPLIIILMVQIQMAFNVNAIPISMGPITNDLRTSATSVGTALVIYSLFVAAFVLVGAKIGKKYGDRLVFQITTILHGFSMTLMALSQSTLIMNIAQAIAGLAAAALVPTLVVLIAANYRTPKQQAKALGALAGAPALSGAMAFLIGGFLGTFATWRITFILLTVLSIVAFILSFRLKDIPAEKETEIDTVGAVLAAISIILISFGANNLNTWGVFLAKDAAPFNFFGLSPAIFMIIFGFLLGQFFFVWVRLKEKAGESGLFNLKIFQSQKEISSIISLMFISAIGPAVNFLIPLYLQIVQNQTTLQTAVAVIPYTLAIATASLMVVSLMSHYSPRVIATAAFIIIAVGLTILSFTISFSWGTPMVIFGLLLVGFAEGSLITLLFNVLVSDVPKHLAGDVGAVRGVANNLSTALGTALAGVISVSLLSAMVISSLMRSTVPNQLDQYINFDNISFISNDQLYSRLSQLDLTEEEIDEAVQININARQRSLRASFFLLAGFSLLAIVPSRGLPGYDEEEPYVVPPPTSSDET
jgi:predicted MFS family arabinose efflux permease